MPPFKMVPIKREFPIGSLVSINDEIWTLVGGKVELLHQHSMAVLKMKKNTY